MAKRAAGSPVALVYIDKSEYAAKLSRLHDWLAAAMEDLATSRRVFEALATAADDIALEINREQPPPVLAPI